MTKKNPFGSPLSKNSNFTPKGDAGYDNPRENIDPHVKTKVIDAKEGIIKDLKLINGTEGGVLFLDSNLNIVEDAPNLFWNNSTKRLGIGTNNPFGELHIAQGDLFLTNSVDQVFNAALTITYRSRGSEGSETAVQDSDVVGGWVLYAHDGNSYKNICNIICEVDGTPGPNSMPGRMMIYTTPTGSTTPLEAMRISQDQSVLFKNAIETESTTGLIVPLANGYGFKIKNQLTGVYFNVTLARFEFHIAGEVMATINAVTGEGDITALRDVTATRNVVAGQISYAVEQFVAQSATVGHALEIGQNKYAYVQTGALTTGEYFNNVAGTIELHAVTVIKHKFDMINGDYNPSGDIYFTNAGSGLLFGEIWVEANSTTTSVISSSHTQITIFANNGHSNGTTPDHTNDHITISKAGKYMVNVSATVENNAGSGHVIHLEVQKNNGATVFTNVHSHRTLASGTDKGSMTLSGIIDVSANDTIELWATTDSASAKNITVYDVTLSLTMVGR